MATKTPTPLHCIQHSRYSKQDGWLLFDLSLSSSGKFAVSGLNKDTFQTSIEVYSFRKTNMKDEPILIYTKKFKKYSTFFGLVNSLLRLVSFVDDNVVTCIGDKLELIHTGQDEILRSRKIDGEARCLSVRETEIFISYIGSNSKTISVYSVTDFHQMKTINLQEIRDGYIPSHMTVIADRIFISEAQDNVDHRLLCFKVQDGEMLSELIKPTDTKRYIKFVTVCKALGVVVAAWADLQYYAEGAREQVEFYSLLNESNSSFLSVEIEQGVNRICISDSGDRLIAKDHFTREVKLYDMADVFTYGHLKKNLVSQLREDECEKLRNFFALRKHQTDAIIGSDKIAENLLFVLEEKGVIAPSEMHILATVFLELNINPYCIQLVDFYQRTRMTWMHGPKLNPALDNNTGIWMMNTSEASLRDSIQLGGISAFQKRDVLTIEATLSNEGVLLETEETDITLVVPPNALEKSQPQCVIQMRIIPYDSCGAPTSFSSNSSVIAELLPNDLRFQRPVELTLPHCLQLKEDVEYKAKIFMGHLEQGSQPSWEEVIEQQYVLEDRTCTIWLNRFCWVKYEIDDDIVEAKRIKIYTAAKPVCVPDDIAEVVVGYHLDLPGAGETLRLNPGFVVEQRWPYLFVKEGKYALKVFLEKVLSHTWKVSSTEENPQEIPFQIVALSIEYSCRFILEQDTKSCTIPTCIFKASQNKDGLRLHVRLKAEETQNVKIEEPRQEASFQQHFHSSCGTEIAVCPKIPAQSKQKDIGHYSTSNVPTLCQLNGTPQNETETYRQMSAQREYQMFPHRRIAAPLGQTTTELINEMLTLTESKMYQSTVDPVYRAFWKEMLGAELDARVTKSTNHRAIASTMQALWKKMQDKRMGSEPTSPKHPLFCKEKYREMSLFSWPTSSKQHPYELAEAGFFRLGDAHLRQYLQIWTLNTLGWEPVTDQVTCFYCGITLCNWEPEDDPWEEHARHSPGCPWLLWQKGQLFIDQVTKKYSNSENSLDLQTTILPEDLMRSAFARNPDYCIESSRRGTFTNWPINHRQNPHILAQAGFFSCGNNDHVECFYCGVNLANWEPHNEPWEEHARHSPRCHWLMEQKGKRFIDAVTKKYENLREQSVALEEIQEGEAMQKQSSSSCQTQDIEEHQTTSAKRKQNETEYDPLTNNRLLVHQLEEVIIDARTIISNHFLESNQTASGQALHSFLNDTMSNLSSLLRKELVDLRPASSLYPEYCNTRKRLLSFLSWPPLYHQQTDALAEAGFFSLGIDRVACFHCGKTLVNWVAGAQPWEEHARHSPGCLWILERKGQHFIDEVAKEYSNSEDTFDIKTMLLDGSRNLLDVYEKYPNYCDESARRATFSTWPASHRQRPLDLAQAGFISRGFEDHVECFYCGVNLGNWEPQYDPWQEHARHSPRCLWLLKQKGQCFIDDVTKKYDTLQNYHTPAMKDGHHKPSDESVFLLIFAKYQEYCFKGSRRKSFSNWPVDHRQRLDTLAQAGFFSNGVGEEVTCFYCGETIVYWDSRNEPWEEHAQYSPTCKWLLHEKGQSFIDEVREKYVVDAGNKNPPRPAFRVRNGFRAFR